MKYIHKPFTIIEIIAFDTIITLILWECCYITYEQKNYVSTSYKYVKSHKNIMCKEFFFKNQWNV